MYEDRSRKEANYFRDEFTSEVNICLLLFVQFWYST